jgi:hypothetical protein
MLGNDFNGFTYGPLGTFLSELFLNVRYSGTSFTFNMDGAFAYDLIWLATHYSLTYVGFIDCRGLYLSYFRC